MLRPTKHKKIFVGKGRKPNQFGLVFRDVDPDRLGVITASYLFRAEREQRLEQLMFWWEEAKEGS
jgi:hypothetical protein